MIGASNTHRCSKPVHGLLRKETDAVSPQFDRHFEFWGVTWRSDIRSLP